ncbi:hypothetical protein [Paracoccus niistensis]|uniref:Uncharacterized protein n=1 Tax=Paracoccus niistensis TaxID=632935 RepID=A0ABV6I7V1_9RHOB
MGRLIDLLGAGSVRFAFGVQVIERLIARSRDSKDGWYCPG